jgi:putative acetyltransferase
MRVRTYKIGDTEEIMKLFYDTVHEVNTRDYTKEQVDAWAPANMDIEVWNRRLTNKLVYVAENNGKILGFGELEEDGHIDGFYCHKDFQRKGIGTQLLKSIESKANFLGIKKLLVEVSITAKSFFESQGFIVVRQQEVECRGQKLINFRMEKIIA